MSTKKVTPEQEKEQGAPEAEKVTVKYVVADRKSITSRKGMLMPGTEVQPDFFADGDAGKRSMEALLEKGVVTKVVA